MTQLLRLLLLAPAVGALHVRPLFAQSPCGRSLLRHTAPILAEGFGRKPNEQPPLTPPYVQKKAKSKTDRFELQFTCNKCETRNVHSISRLAYGKGTVIATCPGCGVAHLLADNLNWIEDDFKNLKEAMAKRGTPVTDLRVDANLERAARSQAAAAGVDMPTWNGQPRTEAPPSRIDGISEEQAERIREAVRSNKRRRGQAPAEQRAAAQDSGENSADNQ